MNLINIISVAFLFFILSLWTGCKSDSEALTPPSVPSVYLGTFASATESGIITLTATRSGTIDSINGTLRVQFPSPATIPLIGTLLNDTVAVRGGSFRLAGTATGFRLSGSFLGPTNSIGAFATQVSTNNAGTIYCGTYTTQVSGGENGTFNVVIMDVSVTGVAISTTGQNPTILNGSVVGTVVNIPNVGAGALNGNSITGGTFTFGTNHGTWSATVCQ